MMQPAFFHQESDSVRFWVAIDGVPVGAIVSRQTLHFRFRPGVQGDDPMETYKANADELAAAVMRRVAAGSIEPVMLREFDLRSPG
jgi:hypothetical protein